MSHQQPRQKNLRQGRYSENELFYFLTAITKDRQAFFSNTTAAQIVLDTLKWLNKRERIKLVAAVVMQDHLHFVAQLKETPLSKVMHSLKSYSANEINRVLGRNGQVWERQYYEREIRDEESLIEVVRYCLENPVRKGLVEDFKMYPHWYCMYEFD